MNTFVARPPRRHREIAPVPPPIDPARTVAHDDALRSLFAEQYVAMVRTATALLGRRADAEEVVQEAFIRMGAVIDRVPPETRTAYLHRVVVNQARGSLRHDRARKRQPRPLAEAASTPEDDAVASDGARRLLALLDELPERQRTCLVLRYHAGLTDTEIADALGLSLGSAKTHLRRGLEALRTKASLR